MTSLLNSTKRKTKVVKPESKEAEEILQKGVENIYQSFNITHKNYKEKISLLEKEVNNLSQKIETMKKEIEMIQRENKYYKEKNNNLKDEIEKLNKIVDNIKGKLTDEDEELNKCFKDMSIKNLHLRTFYGKNNNKFKNNNNNIYLYNTYKNSIHGENKKNKLINLCLKEKNNSLNFITENKNNEAYNSSFDLKLGINHIIHNNNFLENKGKYRVPNTFHNKYRTAHISREEKIKRNNYLDKSEDLPKEFSIINNKNISLKQYIKPEIENNKIIDDISDINHEDLNIKELNKILLSNNNINSNITKNSKIKKLGQKVCLTYDNLFNNITKENNTNKNNYNTFRGKIFNKNISEKIIQKNGNNDKEKVTFFLNKCKSLLDKDSVENIINIFKEYKEGLITDKGIIFQIKKYIWNKKELIELFNEVFSK